MKRLLALLTGALLATQAQAATFLIGSLGHNSGGGFSYSLVHEGTGPGAMSGTVLGWMDLDPTWTGSSLDALGVVNDGLAFYRESDGALEFKATVYSDAALTVSIGSVVVTGTGLLPSELDGIARTNTVAGLLTYDFAVAPASALAAWLGGPSGTQILSFVDRDYGPSTTSGVKVNRYEVGEIALWGARGFPAEVNASGGAHLRNVDWLTAHPSEGKQTGTDLVVELAGVVTDCTTNPHPDCTPVPEPATFVLLGGGLVGLVIWRYRN